LDLKKIVFMGLGAIGTAYASAICKLERVEAWAILDGERKSSYEKEGVTANGEPLNIKYVKPDEGKGDAELIIVSVKAGQLEQAIKDMKSHVGENTLILSLMNGIESEEAIAAEFGDKNIIYGLSVAIDALRQGRATTFTTLGIIRFGRADNREKDEAVKAISALFDEAGITYEVPDDMIYAIWKKFMLNCGVNQVSAVLGLDFGLLRSIPEAGELVEAAMRECAAVAAKSGAKLGESDVLEWRQIVSVLSSGGKTSMLQDVEAGRPTETDIMGGEVARRGEKYGIPTPVNSLLCTCIKALEKKADMS
jgi:2-dehydropantoate 2-reductase